MVAEPPENLEPLALEALLRWYVAMGADAAVTDVPRDWFGEPASPRPGTRDPAPQPTASPSSASRKVASSNLPPPAVADATSSSASLIAQAEALAAEAMTLDDLGACWASVPGCGLAATASRMIFEGGTRGARLMLVGGAPDSDDERQGSAFAGGRGRLLDAMLKAIGLDRGQVYLANVIPWRPPGNRAPTPLELGLCLPFARRQIELAAPSALVCLGERAGQPLLVTSDPISRLRGRWTSFEGRVATVPTLVTFSLDYLLKQPLQKRRAWADLLMVATQLRS